MFSFWLQLLSSQICSTTKPGDRAHTSPTPQMMESYFWDSHQASCCYQGEPHSQWKLHTHNLHTRHNSPFHWANTTFPFFSGKQWKCHTSRWALFLCSTTYFWDPVWLPKKQSLGKKLTDYVVRLIVTAVGRVSWGMCTCGMHKNLK